MDSCLSNLSIPTFEQCKAQHSQRQHADSTLPSLCHAPHRCSARDQDLSRLRDPGPAEIPLRQTQSSHLPEDTSRIWRASTWSKQVHRRRGLCMSWSTDTLSRCQHPVAQPASVGTGTSPKQTGFSMLHKSSTCAHILVPSKRPHHPEQIILRKMEARIADHDPVVLARLLRGSGPVPQSVG